MTTTYRHPDTGETVTFSSDVPNLDKAGWERVEDKAKKTIESKADVSKPTVQTDSKE